MTLTIGHWKSSFNDATSPISKFQTLFFYFCWGCRRNYFLHLFQNSSAICCTQRHLLSEYRFGPLNSPDGGMTTFVFIVRRWLGDSGISLFVSFIVSTVNGLELMINSTSVISVTRDSLFTEWLCVFNNSSKMDLAKQIWRSHTPLIWKAPGGLVCHKIQSAPSLVERSLSFRVISLSMPFPTHCCHQQNLNHCLTILNGLNLSLTWASARLRWRYQH